MSQPDLAITDTEWRGLELVTIARAAEIRGVTVQAINDALSRGALTTYIDSSDNERRSRLVDRAEL